MIITKMITEWLQEQKWNVEVLLVCNSFFSYHAFMNFVTCLLEVHLGIMQIMFMHLGRPITELKRIQN